MAIRLATLCAAIFFIPCIANALTLEELKRYSKDGKVLTSDELRIYQLHKDDPVLAKYDLDTNGKLDAKELRELHADIEKRYGAGKQPAGKEKLSPQEIFGRGKGSYEATHGGIPLVDLVEKPKKVPDECNPEQNIYVRKDRLDTYLYGITPRAKAKGASVSYTDDHVAAQRTATFDGVVAYVLWRDPCRPRPPGYTIDDAYLSAYAVAPWISAHGSINDPIKKSEKNDLKVGLDLQVTFFGGRIFNYQAITISPYAQTDFRGDAQVAGLSGFWEPYQLAVRLGGSPRLLSEYIDWYWQFRGETDIKHVDKVGFTGLQLGRYAWVGATVRVHAFLFPTSAVVPEFLRNRLHATGTFQAYWDAYSAATISKYSVELAYNLTEDGAASVSVEYERGTNKDTLDWVNQYLVKLNYKY